jgi:hypothetical protein
VIPYFSKTDGLQSRMVPVFCRWNRGEPLHPIGMQNTMNLRGASSFLPVFAREFPALSRLFFGEANRHQQIGMIVPMAGRKRHSIRIRNLRMPKADVRETSFFRLPSLMWQPEEMNKSLKNRRIPFFILKKVHCWAIKTDFSSVLRIANDINRHSERVPVSGTSEESPGGP